jgi:hypothetical protein
MAFDQSTRNRLQKLVSDCRRLLSDEFSIQLQQTYGIDPNNGDVTSLDRLSHLSDRDRHTAQLLRDTLAHYLAGEGEDKDHRIHAIDRIIREQAFTVLNRLAALLMMEARGLLLASVSKGHQSQAFELYKRIAGSALGDTGEAYHQFLLSIFDEFAIDLPGLFDRYAAQGRLFPRQPALLAALDELNHHDIQPLWAEDETIGWIYQYFNSKEERKKMRDASPAPRNGRELAVRNQFFTPRYVVEFLVDNTLGRMWFNATGGQSSLRERCQYLLVKPDEQPKTSARLRDPRTLKLLDPACGSMHFGLYAFDLFLQIYQEAWNWEQQHGPGSLDVSTQPEADFQPLCHTYSDQDAFLRDAPRLIIEHNIYGVDIDPRAAQIASLALWLRGQRAWHDAGVKAQHRPNVGRGHIVAAVAPPAERDLRMKFITGLDGKDAELFEKTLQLLKGLPELGILLQVEKELPALIQQVYVGAGTGLFAEEEQDAWQKAEDRVRFALNEFAHASKSTYQGQLFAQDALEGLRVIDLVSHKYDVIVMNPPFGDSSIACSAELSKSYQKFANNLFCMFLARSTDLVPHGYIGAITDSTWLKKADYEMLRESVLDGELKLETLVDLGWGVLDDANVATCAFVLSSVAASSVTAIDLTNADLSAKESRLQGVIRSGADVPGKGEELSVECKILPRDFFNSFPGRAIAHEVSDGLLNLFLKSQRISPFFAVTRRGYTPGDTFRFFRLWWEVMPIKRGAQWRTLNNGGSYSPLITDGLLLAYRDEGWAQYRQLKGFRLESEAWFGKPGIAWGKRTEFMYAYPLPAGSVFSHEGHCAFPKKPEYTWPLLAYLNSSLGQDVLNLFCGQHKLAGYVSKMPCPPLDSEKMIEAGSIAKAAWGAVQKIMSSSEQSEFFTSLFVGGGMPMNVGAELCGLSKFYLDGLEAIDRLVLECACDTVGVDEIKLSGHRRQKTFVEKYVESFDWARSLISDLCGELFGRLNDYSSFALEVGSTDPFDPLPYMVHSEENETSKILVDDSTSKKDITGRIHDLIKSRWGDKSEEIEIMICERLGVGSVGEYIRKSSGFFADHCERYTKGRRQAPIYWPISTETNSYTIWLYYKDLKNQTLFSIVNDFLDPKLNDIRSELSVIRAKTLNRSRAEEKNLEALTSLEYELVDMRDILLEIAPNYYPNHDDGVQINAAPLWKLIRHKPWQKVLKETWVKLEKGDYDWAHLAIHYWPGRVREKCIIDKSLAIAHELEHLYVEPEPKPAKARGRKKVGAANE